MMKDDDLARLRAAYAAPPAGAIDIENHPEPDRIWQAVRGELRADEIREIVDHTALCASCGEDWRIAMAFEEEARAQDEPRRSSVNRFRPWVAAAAAALVMTVSGIYVQQKYKPDPGYRGEEGAIRSLAGDTRPRGAFVLSWTPVAGAESYDVFITTADLTAVAEARRLTTPSYQVPPDSLAELPSGTRIHWRVTAVYPDGARKQSPSFMTALQ